MVSRLKSIGHKFFVPVNKNEANCPATLPCKFIRERCFYPTKVSQMLRRKISKSCLASTVSAERLEQIIEVSQRKFPAIFTGSAGERGVLLTH